MSQYKNEVIDPGDKLSKMAAEVCRDSYGNCPAIIVKPFEANNFRGGVSFTYSEAVMEYLRKGEIEFIIENDGNGHKPGFPALLGMPVNYRESGHDLIAMTADDTVRRGGMACIMSNQIDVRRITDESLVRGQALLDGYRLGLRQQRLVNLTGETAVMKYAITTFCDDGDPHRFVYTWNGACYGIVHKSRKLSPANVKVGNFIVGLREKGARCNGNSKSVALVQATWGADREKILENQDAVEFIGKLCKRSQSYAKFIADMQGYLPDGSVKDRLVDIKAIAHITGGGVWGKLPEALPEGVGAIIKLKRSDLLAEIQERSFSAGLNFSDAEMIGDYHGDCGMMVIVEDEIEADKLIARAEEYGIEAYKAGHTTASEKKEIYLESPYRENRWITSLEF